MTQSGESWPATRDLWPFGVSRLSRLLDTGAGNFARFPDRACRKSTAADWNIFLCAAFFAAAPPVRKDIDTCTHGEHFSKLIDYGSEHVLGRCDADALDSRFFVCWTWSALCTKRDSQKSTPLVGIEIKTRGDDTKYMVKFQTLR